ncbi:MAG: acyl-CoA dehydratase activase [Syntrophomonadaceae bacterium]|nr:acyl-CoA dehydratase activase [Syntrophomonadaceae bacterium]
MITAGADIGSSSSKILILEDGEKILSAVVIPVGTGSSGPDRAFAQALDQAGLTRDKLGYIVATGYGRRHFEADRQFSEITCHARGIAWLMPEARTIIDIGGQDAKAIRIEPGGSVGSFIMNDKCAAGTGRFLDVMSRVLEVDVSELAALADESKQEAAISSTCTVFAESEVISQLAQAARREDVAAGVIRSVVRRCAGLVKRVGPEAPVVMTGGVSLNPLAVRFMQEELSIPVMAASRPQLTGALGAALLAARELSKLKAGAL